ncbi:LysM peptidoglycan-binding domain-containing protein [Geodermatophilus sp. SYSU D00758]
MVGVQQAVLDFDDAVQVPWRPRLRAVPQGGGIDAGSPLRRPGARPGVSRVGVFRPPASPGAGRPAPRATVRAARPAAPPRPAAPTRPRPAAGAPRTAVAGRAAGPLGGAVAGRPVRGRCAPVARAPRLRLTRRARRLSVVLALAVGVVLGAWGAGLVAGGSDELRLVGDRSVVVRSGDTLWSIAGEVAGDGADVRAVVDAIQEMNHLDGGVIVPGQVLVLP